MSNVRDLLLSLIQSQRLVLSGLSSFLMEESKKPKKSKGRPSKFEDIYGQEITSLQRFIAEASVGAKTFGDNGAG